MIQTQRAPKGFALEFETGEEARTRRDLLVATLPWPPPCPGLEGIVKGWFDQAEEAMQALHGMPSSEAKYYKGRSKGLRTVTVPLEAKVQENRFERASE
eukprot:6577098-Pyramimonas_sp.AAC.1